jgi:uncharacterized protein YidB (DUF937 family)
MSLFDLIGGARRGGMSPIAMALLGVLAYHSVKGKGRLADMFGAGSQTPAANGPGESSGLGGGLSAALGGGALGKGLQDLIGRFRNAGHEDKVQSWVATGPNQPIASGELEKALGEERVQWLMEQTGLPKAELLAGLSKELPETVDKLTPNGVVPKDEQT